MKDSENTSYLDVLLTVVTVAVVFFLDRWTKHVFTGILDLNESLPVIHGVFHFTLVHNTGIAFGLFKNQGAAFIIIPIIAVILLAYNIYYYHHQRQRLSRIYIFAFSLILGGAIGNLTDRISYGYVVDFIDLRIWPVFNIADSAITVGALLIAFKCLPWKRTSS